MMRSGLVLSRLGVAIATQATRTTGVHVQFLAQLVAGQSDLVGVRMITWLPESACGA